VSTFGIGSRTALLVEKFRNTIGLPFRDILSEVDIEAALQDTKAIYRKRLFSPSVTIWTFLSQVLDPDHSCRKAVARVAAHLTVAGRPSCSEDTSAYCQARKRLPSNALPILARQVGLRMEKENLPEELWRGRPVRIVDGSSVSMPDTPANQQAYPQPSEQKPGCGFPVATLVALFSWSTGALLDAGMDSLRVQERTLFHRIWGSLHAGDVLVTDRGFCSYADIVLLKSRDIDSVMRLHQKKRADFRRGTRLGPGDHLVKWHKGIRPRWMSPEEFDGLPNEITVREIRFHIDIPGFRTREIVLVTTLLDPVAYPKDTVVELYRDRWFCELNLRNLKTSLQMEVLRGHSPDIVCKEVWVHILLYNLLRHLMGKAAREHRVPARRLSVKGTFQRVNVYASELSNASDVLCSLLLQRLLKAIAADKVPDRPNRIEPRARKRRPKKYPLLMIPRRQAQRRLTG
jgi:hypothetical protein